MAVFSSRNRALISIVWLRYWPRPLELVRTLFRMDMGERSRRFLK